MSINYTSGLAKDSTNDCGWWGGNKRRGKGRKYAGIVMRDWGITKDGSTNEPSYSDVRDPNSSLHLSCEVVEDIYSQSSLQYDDAFDRHEECGSLAKKCKCRADIDMAKWAEIRDWADGARRSQGDKYNTCDETEWEAAGKAVTDLQSNLLADKTNVGMSNTVKMALIGTGVLLTIVVLLKVVKK
tara:strand:- start:1747 stop:2301 length:555 start_codon:yes stop_codon:yes gene_type:complete